MVLICWASVEASGSWNQKKCTASEELKRRAQVRADWASGLNEASPFVCYRVNLIALSKGGTKTDWEENKVLDGFIGLPVFPADCGMPISQWGQIQFGLCPQ